MQKLLAEDGVIFISIDDNELYYLKAICDEIFGKNCFVANVVWHKTYSPRNDSGKIPYETDSILVYRKTVAWVPATLDRTDKMNSTYKSPDGDPVPWTSGDPCAADSVDHQGSVYAIQHPITGKLMYPPAGSHWRFAQDVNLSIMNEWASYELIDIDDDEERARLCGISREDVRPNVKAIMLSTDIASAQKAAQERYQQGVWPTLYFTGAGKGGLRRKNHIEGIKGRTATNLWSYKEVGHTDEATKELKDIFGGTSPLKTPKPVRLLERILKLASEPDSIILDSFAGSGTTAHAVLKANQADGGHRRFILVELSDYAETTTAERVRRVISGYKKDEEAKIFDIEITAKNLIDGPELLEQAKAVAEEAKGKYSKVSKPKIVDGHLQVIATQKAADQEPGIPGSFSYYELGVPLFSGDVLNPDAPLTAIRAYVFYTEAHRPLPAPIETDPYLLGVESGAAYYFCYQKDGATILDHTLLSSLKTRAEKYIIYADLNALSDEELKCLNITFKKIPRDIPKL